ncbi:MAG: 50S ribosomal protein L25 [Myxococcota bacterium]|nr:50S ribosomal protein L25 [Myxococcota bacterium]
MAENALQVEIREGTGKGVARKLRAAGRIPAVCYGKKDAAVALSVDPKVLRHLLEHSDAGMNTIISLDVAGDLNGRMVLLRELQRDPVRGRFLHADFYTVDLEQTIEVSVPLHLTGKAAGVELGGILDQQLREIDLECLPLAIPREVEVDVSPLMLGDSLHVRDISLPEGVTLRSDPDLSIVSVVAPSKAEEEAPGAAEGEVPEGEEAAPAEAEAAEKPAEGGGEAEKSGD